MLSRICECIAEFDAPRIKNLMDVHLRKDASEFIYQRLLPIYSLQNKSLDHSIENFLEKVEAALLNNNAW